MSSTTKLSWLATWLGQKTTIAGLGLVAGGVATLAKTAWMSPYAYGALAVGAVMALLQESSPAVQQSLNQMIVDAATAAINRKVTAAVQMTLLSDVEAVADAVLHQQRAAGAMAPTVAPTMAPAVAPTVAPTAAPPGTPSASQVLFGMPVSPT